MPKYPDCDCDNCPLVAEPLVPPSGPQEARIAVVGEAPGFHEAEGGEPFVGPSGRLLDTVLKHHGLDRKAIRLTNTVLCRPPDNRVPSKIELKCCSKRLTKDLENAEIIVALGNTAASAVTGQKTKITTFRAGPPKSSPLYPNAKVIPTIHPAACLRSADSFPSLVTDIGKVNGTVSVGWEPPAYRAFTEATEADAALRELSESRVPFLVVDIETAFDKDIAFEHPDHYRLLCVGIGFRRGGVIVVGNPALQDSRVREVLARNIADRDFVAQNGKFDLQGLHQIVNHKLSFDTMLASYCVDERAGTHGLEYLSTEVLGAPDWKHLPKKYKSYADVPWEELAYYNAIDCHNTRLLRDHYNETLTSDGQKLHRFLVRASNALIPVELEGIKVDCDELARLKVAAETSMENLETELSRWVANPRSVPQVTKALQELGVPVVSTTDAEFLKRLANNKWANEELRKFCSLMLEYRKEQKLYGTYIAGAEKRLYNGRLYPTFLLHSTVTGRLSCRNPNLQNIPRGSSIRNLFVPEAGNVFVQCDYSQIELRVVACLARDEYLRGALSDPNRDVHQEIADRLGITRQRAKMVVYGLSYEMSANGLAYRLGIPLEEAAGYIREFHDVIPAVVRWKKSVQDEVLSRHEDLTTPYGRHRRFWLITPENREDILKESIAFKPQSIASDINLTAGCELVERGHKLRLLVHDSLMVECRAEDAPDVAKEMEAVMLEAGRQFDDYVPFAVEVKTGTRWGQL